MLLGELAAFGCAKGQPVTAPPSAVVPARTTLLKLLLFSFIFKTSSYMLMSRNWYLQSAQMFYLYVFVRYLFIVTFDFSL